MPCAIVAPFVLAHHADRAEAHPSVRPNGALVGDGGIDRQEMVPAPCNEIAGECTERIAAKALALVGAGDEKSIPAWR